MAARILVMSSNCTTTNVGMQRIVKVDKKVKKVKKVKEDWRDNFKLDGKGKSRSPKRLAEGERLKGVTPHKYGGYQVRFKKSGHDFYMGIYNNLEDANRCMKYSRRMIEDLEEQGFLIFDKNSK